MQHQLNVRMYDSQEQSLCWAMRDSVILIAGDMHHYFLHPIISYIRLHPSFPLKDGSTRTHLLLQKVLVVLFRSVKCRNRLEVDVHLPLAVFPHLFDFLLGKTPLFIVAVENSRTVLAFRWVIWSMLTGPLRCRTRETGNL